MLPVGCYFGYLGNDHGVKVAKGIPFLSQQLNSFGQQDQADNSPELAILRALMKDIEGGIPPDPLGELRKKLQMALRDERYEEAAALRDQIRTAGSGGEANSQQ